MTYLWVFYVLVGMSKILTAEPLYQLRSTFKIVYRIRIYQRVGPSREQWREMIPPDVRDIPSTETKERCAAGLVSPSVENKTKAEQLVGQHGKLLTWSDDGTMFAYVDPNPAIPPPKPNPWGCDDCFFPDLKVIRASDAKTHLINSSAQKTESVMEFDAASLVPAFYSGKPSCLRNTLSRGSPRSGTNSGYVRSRPTRTAPNGMARPRASNARSLSPRATKMPACSIGRH